MAMIKSANVIFAIDMATRVKEVVFGRRLLDAIANNEIPAREMVEATFAIDFQNNNRQGVRDLCAAVRLVKGSHEWPTEFVTVLFSRETN